jgi:uncharacterized protein YjbI with pentapeptide repeats
MLRQTRGNLRQTTQADRPLTRDDVEKMLASHGGSAGLNLSDANLQHIDLHGVNLSGAVLTRANLTGANLAGTELSKAGLSGARLMAAHLERAILDGADLADADLRRANLEDASLSEARLPRAYLGGAQLSRTILYAADLTRAILNGAVVKGSDLRNANLRSVRASNVAFSQAQLEGAYFDEESMVDPSQHRRIAARGAHVPSEWLQERRIEPPRPWGLHLRIDQEPLTARNLATIVSSLHDLHAMSMLLSLGLEADLANYAITRDTEFLNEDELDLVITSISQHSPTEIKVDISPESVGKAVAEAVGAIATIGHRRKEYELRNRELEQDIEIKREQAREDLASAEQERTLARERAELQFEREQLQIERERFAAHMERYNLALETALTLVGQLSPHLNDGERAMAARLILPALLKMEQADGLALVSGTEDHNDGR